ncbi:hypothetical protein [Mycobacterium sp. SMC-4]|uniref:hypothetical protein n=1 Tax=Mycobacterium sp. SMC-4 TaxID=2857059 RepID=UPI003D041B75
MVEEIRSHVGSITLVPLAGLGYWLPGLEVPVGWTVVGTPAEPAPVTRIALRHIASKRSNWDGCETIALYQFTGSVSEEFVQESAGRTLNDLGADNVLHHNVSLGFNSVAAVRSSGWFTIGKRSLWGQFSNYVVNTGAVGGLVEHSVLVEAQFRPRLSREVNQMTQSVLSSLVASLSVSEPSRGLPSDCSW